MSDPQGGPPWPGYPQQQPGSPPQQPGYPPQQPGYPPQPPVFPAQQAGYASGQPAAAAQPGWGPSYSPPPGYGGASGAPGYPPGYGGGYPPPGYGPGYGSFTAAGGVPVAPWMVQAHYGGFWIRFFAYLIDAILVAVICLVLFVTIVGILFIPVVAIGYQPFMWWKYGATLGQRALGLRVVRAVDGGPITGTMAVIRWLVKQFLSGIFMLGYIWAAFEPRKRAWHDILADTVVIHA